MDGTKEAAPRTADFSRRAFLSSVRRGLLVALGFTAATARAAPGRYVGCRADDAAERYHDRVRRRWPRRLRHPAARPRSRRGVSPDCRAVRRLRPSPGTFAVVIDLDRARRWPHRRRGGRHFYGHGAFSPDGRYLFTSENDFEAGRGMIGIRDAEDGYRQIGEFASQGIGPHELVLMPDGATLAVANGGIRTHPDNDRAILNLDTMQPSLAYLDLASGRLRDAFGLAADAAEHPPSRRQRDGAGRRGDAVRGQQARPGAAGRGCTTATFACSTRRPRSSAGCATTPAASPSIKRPAARVSCPRGNLITFWDARRAA